LLIDRFLRLILLLERSFVVEIGATPNYAYQEGREPGEWFHMKQGPEFRLIIEKIGAQVVLVNHYCTEKHAS
jgi:hypothetical protein